MATILLLIICGAVTYALGYWHCESFHQYRDRQAREFHKLKSPWPVSSPGRD